MILLKLQKDLLKKLWRVPSEASEIPPEKAPEAPPQEVSGETSRNSKQLGSVKTPGDGNQKKEKK
jgi:hypothetical protein